MMIERTEIKEEREINTGRESEIYGKEK